MPRIEHDQRARHGGLPAELRRPRSIGLSARHDSEASVDPTFEISVVILTQGTRPAELERAIDSVRAQVGVHAQLVLVLNDAPAPEMREGEVVVALPENHGIPGGRNIGATVAAAPVILFLDDDAELLSERLLASVVQRFRADPQLGAMAMRLVDEHGETQRRHIPRLGEGSSDRPGPVTYFIGAAAAVRGPAFFEVGGFDPTFFYAMEESDLSWRLLDAGWSIWYSADLPVFHPRTAPSRHRDYAVLTARNRFWMAWRSLPVLLMLAYVSVWGLAAVVRGAPAGDVLAGYREAVRARPVRNPMRWRTVLRMTRLGRPPIM